MNTFQRIIKYLAIAFAIFLTVGIVSGIVGVISGVISIFDNEEVEKIDYSMDFYDVEGLKISNGAGKLSVKTGSGFRVEATNVSTNFRAKISNGILEVDDSRHIKKFLWFNFGTSNNKSVITVYVPEDFNARKIDIESGVGKVILDDLSAERLILDAGVGDLQGYNLIAMKAEINGGVGNMDLKNINFTDLDIDSGVGNVTIEGMLLGKSEIDCGIGELNLKVKGEREDYAININAGLGTIKIDGSKVSRDYNDTYKADNTIGIDGGIGNLEIVFGY